MTWTISIASDLRVVSYNPENADLDFPHGERIGEVFYFQATNDRGDRRRYGSYPSAEIAENSYLFTPCVDFWYDDEPEYGSKAWLEYGELNQIEAERKLNEMQSAGFDTRFMMF